MTRQSWRSLLFAHWPVPVQRLRPLVPAGLDVETRDGSAWVSLTPFRLHDLRPRFLPAVPLLSTFLELNLRTYVRHGGRPGVFFFSLDCESRLAVFAARILFALPYRTARMSMRRRDGWIDYRSVRRHADAVFVGRYRPIGDVCHARPGSLEHFLVERYAQYAQGPEALLRADIDHEPWPLRRAEAHIERNTIAPAAGLRLDGPPALLHYCDRQDTITWPARRVDRKG